VISPAGGTDADSIGTETHGHEITDEWVHISASESNGALKGS